jgi:hypothetical protein
MKNLFEMLQAIFGKNIISRTIGTRTNVIKLPSNKSSPLKNEFDVFRSSENPAVFEKLKKVIEDEAPYISRMNDAERLIYEGNVKRLHDYLVSIGEIKPTITAEVIGIGTKEPIAGKGLASLVEEAGQTSPPGTLAGDIQSRINKLKGLGKEMEKQTGEKATLTDVLKDLGASQQSMSRLNDEGLVRSTAREILINDIKAGKIKNITVSEAINMGEPLDPFRRIYGEGALEQLDSLIPDFRNLKTEMEAEKFARSKFKFEPDENRLPGSTSIEEGRKAEQEFGINKSTTEVEEPQAEIIPFKKKPEEFAIGGPVGLDYLTGMVPSEGYADGERTGFAIGGSKKILDLIAKVNKKLKGKKSMETIDRKTGDVVPPKEPVMTAENKSRRLTQDEIKDYEEQLGDSETWMSEGTVEEAEKALKRSKAEEAYMFQQYKMGRLDPAPGEQTQGRMDFLRKKAEYAEDVKDRRLFTLDEMNELDELEKIFEPRSSSNINISDPKTAESFTNFIKENDPEGFKKIQKIVDDINNKNTLKEFNIKDRKPNAKGGLNYLVGE